MSRAQEHAADAVAHEGGDFLSDADVLGFLGGGEDGVEELGCGVLAVGGPRRQRGGGEEAGVAEVAEVEVVPAFGEGDGFFVEEEVV